MAPDLDDAAERLTGAEQSIDGPLFDDSRPAPRRAASAPVNDRPFVMRPPRISKSVVRPEHAEDARGFRRTEPLNTCVPDALVDLGAGDCFGVPSASPLRPDGTSRRHRVGIDAGGRENSGSTRTGATTSRVY